VTARVRDVWWRGTDEGSALVEFVFLAVLLLVPIVYLIVAMARIQAGALAAEQGAREASRAFVTASDVRSAQTRAGAAVVLAYRDQGFGPPQPGQLTIRCGGPSCLSAGAHVTVRAQLTVVLPGVPRFLTHVIPVAVTVQSTHVASVDEFARR
jgi:hypothetical protein